MRHPVFFEIALMIIFGRIELGGRSNLGDDGSSQSSALVQPFFRGPGGGLLLGSVKKDRRPILMADVRSLAIHGCRIVYAPKHTEQFVIRDHGRIEFDLANFSVPRCSRAHLLVGWVGKASPGISNGCRYHALYLPEGVFNAPKATGRKKSCLHLVRTSHESE